MGRTGKGGGRRVNMDNFGNALLREQGGEPGGRGLSPWKVECCSMVSRNEVDVKGESNMGNFALLHFVMKGGKTRGGGGGGGEGEGEASQHEKLECCPTVSRNEVKFAGKGKSNTLLRAAV